jgi:hypothetical protein
LVGNCGIVEAVGEDNFSCGECWIDDFLELLGTASEEEQQLSLIADRASSL